MRAEQLTGAIRPLVEAGAVPGAVVGVRHRGEPSLDAVGATEPGGGTALSVDAVVRITSNTKPIVAALTLALVEDGLLALDDLVERFVPELADRRVLRRLDGPVDETVPADRPITVADLLTMRMGFGFVVEGECPAFDAATGAGLGFGPPDPPALPAPHEWIARFAALPLLEQPGTAWRYELAFGVLGVVLARAAGRPLDVLLHERLLAPLGMTDTAFTARPERLVPAFSRTDDGLDRFDSGGRDSRWSDAPAFPDARGGLVSTAADLLRFAGALLDGGAGVLSPAAVAAMTTDQLTAGQRGGPAAQAFLDGGGWGYGVGVVDSPAGRRYGWAGGLGTLWYSWPDHDLAVVLVTQVLPPAAEVFGALTAAVESALTAA